MKDGMLLSLVLTLVRRLPLLLLLLGGTVYAIARWQRHPRASLLVVLASLIYLVEGLLLGAIIYQLPVLLYYLDFSSKTESWLYSAVYFLEDFVYAAIIVLLVAAAFSGRTRLPLPNTNLPLGAS